MLIRDSLRKEMEKKLEEMTKAEIKAELEACALLKDIHVFISTPSKWENILKENLWPDNDEWQKRYAEIWESFDKNERREIAALFAGLHFDILDLEGNKQVVLGQMMNILDMVKTEFLERRSLLEARHRDIAISLRTLESRKSELTEHFNHLKERLKRPPDAAVISFLSERLDLTEEIRKNFQYPIKYEVQKKLKDVFSFIDGGLKSINNKLANVLKNLPHPIDMPCHRALELIFAMRKEGRCPQNREEVTAQEHFSYPYHCQKTPACSTLSRLHSIGLGKHLDDETEFKRAEAEFREIQSESSK